jgi:hypothetical protein
MDRIQMENVIERLQQDEIADALGLLALLERVGEVTEVEAQRLRVRVEARAAELRARVES